MNQYRHDALKIEYDILKQIHGNNVRFVTTGVAGENMCRSAKDRNIFETMRKEFYELRGWDAESGLQKIETLEKLGLSELAGLAKEW